MALASWAKASLFWITLGLASTPLVRADVIDGGAQHACVLDNQGAVWCWGDNSSGQLGNGGANEASAIPARINPILFENRALVSVSAGAFHTCALDSEGEVWCWGKNAYGQLGVGNNTNQLIPKKVSMTSVPSHRFKSISAGGNHTCGIDDSYPGWAGAAFCWGQDAYGTLGDDAAIADTNVPTPVAMPSETMFFALSAGYHFNCAIGTFDVWCWGADDQDQLGNGPNSIDSSSTLLAVSLPAGVQFRSISLGYNHACAIDISGKAWCWGSSFYGGLGNGSTDTKNVPTPVDGTTLPSGTTFAQISTGRAHTCALDTSGNAWCWGNDDYGQLGNDNNRQDSAVPINVPPLLGFGKLDAIAVGDDFTCTIDRQGKVGCWGEGAQGQLGAGDFGSVTEPQSVPVPDAIQVSAGEYHTCALDSQGRAWCWGRNDSGQLGRNNSIDSANPALVDTTSLPASSRFTTIQAGYYHTCALDSTGAAWCWGNNYDGELGSSSTTSSVLTPTPVSMAGLPAGGFTKLATGWAHSCALDVTGKIWCWGWDGYGQLGDGSGTTGHSVPTLVNTGKTFKELSAGATHTCAIDADSGALYCWGNGSNGILGLGDTNNRSVPTALTFMGNTNFLAIAAGNSHTCAAQALSDATSRLFCWGNNRFYAIGNGAAMSDVLAPYDTGLNLSGGSDMSVPVSLALGARYTCAGSSFFSFSTCWGTNEVGQLGDGTYTDRSTATASQLGQVRQLAAGGSHTCAIRINGSLVCVGDNSYGQLGNSMMGDALTPVEIPNFTAWSSELFSDDFEGTP